MCFTAKSGHEALFERKQCSSAAYVPLLLREHALFTHAVWMLLTVNIGTEKLCAAYALLMRGWETGGYILNFDVYNNTCIKLASN